MHQEMDEIMRTKEVEAFLVDWRDLELRDNGWDRDKDIAAAIWPEDIENKAEADKLPPHSAHDLAIETVEG